MVITEKEGLACLKAAEDTALLAPDKTGVYTWPPEVCEAVVKMGWATKDGGYFGWGNDRRDEELMVLAWAVTLSGVVCH